MACTNVRVAVLDRFTQSDVPGPGAYTMRKITVSSTHPEAIRQPMPKAKRPDLIGGSSTPGPGDYTDMSATSTLRPRQTESRIRDIPVVGFPTSPARPSGGYGRHGLNPGPGEYMLDRATTAIQACSPRSVFGTARRKMLEGGGDGPGPADYVLNRTTVYGEQTLSSTATSQRQSMTKAVRGRGNVESLGPGPGAYRVEVLDSLSGRNVSGNRPHSSSATIGRAKREGGLGGGPGDTPGPLYEIDVSPLKPRANLLGSIGRAPRAGPGGEGNGISLGPGQYRLGSLETTQLSSPRTPLGAATRFVYRENPDGPGPTTYATMAGDALQSQRPRSVSTRFGKSPSRPAVRLGEGGDGTAGALLTSFDGRSAPFSKSQRKFGSAEEEGRPGPADYTYSITPLSTTQSTASSPVGKAPRSGFRVLGEGVGKYYLGHGGLGVPLPGGGGGATSPRTAIGKADRFSSVGAPVGADVSTPGPTDYGYTFRVDLPKVQGWTIRAR